MNKKIIMKLFNLIKKTEKIDDFPVSAVIYKDDKVVATGYNKRNKSNDVTDHAEIVAIRRANKKINNWNLQGYNMIVTLEPCHMCEQVIKEARLDNVYYIISRSKTKKPYKNTVIKKCECDSELTAKYMTKITSFFKNKR